MIQQKQHWTKCAFCVAWRWGPVLAAFYLYLPSRGTYSVTTHGSAGRHSITCRIWCGAGPDPEPWPRQHQGGAEPTHECWARNVMHLVLLPPFFSMGLWLKRGSFQACQAALCFPQVTWLDLTGSENRTSSVPFYFYFLYLVAIEFVKAAVYWTIKALWGNWRGAAPTVRCSSLLFLNAAEVGHGVWSLAASPCSLPWVSMAAPLLLQKENGEVLSGCFPFLALPACCSHCCALGVCSSSHMAAPRLRLGLAGGSVCGSAVSRSSGRDRRHWGFHNTPEYSGCSLKQCYFLQECRRAIVSWRPFWRVTPYCL